KDRLSLRASERTAKALGDFDRHARRNDRKNEARVAHERIVVVDYLKPGIANTRDALPTTSGERRQHPRTGFAQTVAHRGAHLARADDRNRHGVSIAHRSTPCKIVCGISVAVKSRQPIGVKVRVAKKFLAYADSLHEQAD